MADLLGHLVDFCRTLRARGVVTTPGQSVLASQVLDVVDVADRQELHLALRTALVSRVEDGEAFDRAFDEMWGPHPVDRPETTLPTGRSETRLTRAPGARRPPPVTLENWMRPSDATDDAPEQLLAASDREALGRYDVATWTNDDAAAFRRLTARLARQLALRPSRRWKSARRGTRIDLRRTLRLSLRTGGDPIVLERRRRRVRRTRVVALCDVSGSMALYSRALLQFLHALQNSFARVETFVFSTRLTRATDALRGAEWTSALAEIGRAATDWAGGTRIGESLAEFTRDWMTLVDGRTVVLVLSDGWETGDPDVLAAALAVIHARAGRVIWLNPLMASDSFTPESRGMAAALPYIDLLAPGHSLASFEALVKELAI